MTDHPIATREQWLEQRIELLAAEKELTRRSDELARRRQALPWVRVEKDYRFATDEGEASLADLFRGRSQLLVYHFMFGPDYAAGCPSCSAIADGYKERLGWTFPWASSFGSDFNSDYAVGLTPEQQSGGYVYNFEEKPPIPADAQGAPNGHAAMCGVDLRTYLKELPGMSAFVLSDGEVFHTYSSYARGLDSLWGMYPWLDRAPLGRNESGPWWKRRDEYEPA
jgi:predicted dithiol-disulfide oxidoreductase (DUF899 family)